MEHGVDDLELGRGTPACYGHLVSSSVFDHIFSIIKFRVQVSDHAKITHLMARNGHSELKHQL